MSLAPPPAAILTAHKRALQIQMKYGHLFSSKVSIAFGNSWHLSLKLDPTGAGLDVLLTQLETVLETIVRGAKS